MVLSAYTRLFGTGTRRGVASMVLGMASFVANDTLIKLASVAAPTGQLVSVRNLMTTLLILALVVATGQAGQLRRTIDPVVMTRSALDIVATLLYLTALFHMPLGNITAIGMTTPLVMTAAASMFLGAAVGWRRWCAVAAGFIGVLLVVQPRAEGFNPYSLVALAGIGFIVARDLWTRRIDQTISSLVVTLTNSVFVLGAALVLSLFEGWVAMALREWLLLGGAGIFLIGGYLLIVDAFRHGDIATVGPFRYTTLLWALFWGWLVWNEIPNAMAFSGIVIIVASGLYVLHRERVRAREAAGTGAAP